MSLSELQSARTDVEHSDVLLYSLLHGSLRVASGFELCDPSLGCPWASCACLLDPRLGRACMLSALPAVPPRVGDTSSRFGFPLLTGLSGLCHFGALHKGLALVLWPVLWILMWAFK